MWPWHPSLSGARSPSSENGSNLFLDCLGHQMHLIREELEANLSEVLCWEFMLSATFLDTLNQLMGKEKEQ